MREGLTLPKMKTHSSTKKRFKVTASGRFKYAKGGKSHLLSSKNRKRKRELRKAGYVTSTHKGKMKVLLPYD